MLNWKKENTNMMIGDKRVEDIVHQFESPIYLYDANIIIDRINRILKSFPDFNLFYSLKANPNLTIAALIKSQGVGVEVASLGEIETALRSGFTASQMGMAGPGKSKAELKRAVELGINLISIESVNEIIALSKISKELGKEVAVLPRVNISEDSLNALEKMAGKSSQFGIDVEILVKQLIDHKDLGVKYRGIHVYAGSQILSLESLVNHFERIYALGKSIADQVGFELECINFGGGFGIPYSLEEQHLDIPKLGGIISQLLKDSGIQLYFELGRYLLAESGLFLVEILDVKTSKGKNYVVANSGINGFARPAMPWANRHRCEIVSKIGEPATDVYTVTGPLCLPSDVLAIDVELPDPKPGDIIAFYGAGAYGYTMSPQLFLSQKTPIEVLYFQNDFHVIRERLDINRFLDEQGVLSALT